VRVHTVSARSTQEEQATAATEKALEQVQQTAVNLVLSECTPRVLHAVQLLLPPSTPELVVTNTLAFARQCVNRDAATAVAKRLRETGSALTGRFAKAFTAAVPRQPPSAAADAAPRGTVDATAAVRTAAARLRSCLGQLGDSTAAADAAPESGDTATFRVFVCAAVEAALSWVSPCVRATMGVGQNLVLTAGMTVGLVRRDDSWSATLA